jgi:hypothetical protein
MLTHHLVGLIKQELNQSGEYFKFSQKPELLMIEHLKTNNIYFVAWNPYRGGSFQVMPCQNSELFDLISHRVHKAVQLYNDRVVAAERRKKSVKQSV